MTRSPRPARPRPPGGSTLAPLRWIAQEELFCAPTRGLRPLVAAFDVPQTSAAREPRLHTDRPADVMTKYEKYERDAGSCARREDSARRSAHQGGGPRARRSDDCSLLPSDRRAEACRHRARTVAFRPNRRRALASTQQAATARPSGDQACRPTRSRGCTCPQVATRAVSSTLTVMTGLRGKRQRRELAKALAGVLLVRGSRSEPRGYRALKIC